MRLRLWVAVFLYSFSAIAQSGAVYCKSSTGRAVNVLKGEWDSCMSELYSGDVCFTGERKKVIEILNSTEVREKFDGTDGEYIRGAHYRGADVGYYAVDEANEWSNLVVIKRCLPTFLRQ